MILQIGKSVICLHASIAMLLSSKKKKVKKKVNFKQNLLDLFAEQMKSVCYSIYNEFSGTKTK